MDTDDSSSMMTTTDTATETADVASVASFDASISEPGILRPKATYLFIYLFFV